MSLLPGICGELSGNIGQRLFLLCCEPTEVCGSTYEYRAYVIKDPSSFRLDICFGAEDSPAENNVIVENLLDDLPVVDDVDDVELNRAKELLYPVWKGEIFLCCHGFVGSMTYKFICC